MRSHYFLATILSTLFLWGGSAISEVTIDYAVFYTPNARVAQGGTQAMLARISTAFEGANELFKQSGLEITHRVVLTQELPINNTSETLPELGTELAIGFDFTAALEAAQADSIVTVVEFQRPGGFANIPISRRQAFGGGKINLGLPNLSAGVLAHEIGHTLGSGHDYAGTNAKFFDDIPTGGSGNHFIGSTTGICYRTIMSALIDCRLPGHEGRATVNSNRFSGTNLLFDGTPTGIADVADNVTVFNYFAPLVASARGQSQIPDPPSDTAPPGDGDNQNPGEEDENMMPDNWDTLTLKIIKNNSRIFASGRCLDSDSTALTGDRIIINMLKRSGGIEKPAASAVCRKNGKFKAALKRKGRYKARNERTGRESEIVRLR